MPTRRCSPPPARPKKYASSPRASPPTRARSPRATTRSASTPVLRSPTSAPKCARCGRTCRGSPSAPIGCSRVGTLSSRRRRRRCATPPMRLAPPASACATPGMFSTGRPKARSAPARGGVEESSCCPGPAPGRGVSADRRHAGGAALLRPRRARGGRRSRARAALERPRGAAHEYGGLLRHAGHRLQPLAGHPGVLSVQSLDRATGPRLARPPGVPLRALRRLPARVELRSRRPRPENPPGGDLSRRRPGPGLGAHRARGRARRAIGPRDRAKNVRRLVAGADLRRARRGARVPPGRRRAPGGSAFLGRRARAARELTPRGIFHDRGALEGENEKSSGDSRRPEKHHSRGMRQPDTSYQTTIRRARGDGHLHFARPSSLLERFLAAALPVLWSLVPLVALVALWWAW